MEAGGISADAWLLGWVTVAAIFAGPIAAVFVTRGVDYLRAKRDRRMDIFRALMRTRRTPMWPDHVGNLNLVEIEFRDEPAVMAAWKDLFTHLGTQHPRRPEEELAQGLPNEEAGARSRRWDERIAQERARLLAKLLHAMAKCLGFRIEQLEIFEGGYTPQGWEDIELEQRTARRFIVDLFLGRRVVPVGIISYVDAIKRGVEPQNEAPPAPARE